MVGTALGLGLVAMGLAYADQPGGVPLKKPVLNGEEATGFPENEAGRCAYIKKEDLDINKVQQALSTVMEKGENYVIGTKEVPELVEELWPNVYANSDGWLIAYYPNTRPASYILPFGYGRREYAHKNEYVGSFTTNLTEALSHICSDLLCCKHPVVFMRGLQDRG